MEFFEKLVIEENEREKSLGDVERVNSDVWLVDKEEVRTTMK